MRGVAYFNGAVNYGTKKLNTYFTFMQPESSNTPRVVRLRVLNTAYKQFHS